MNKSDKINLEEAYLKIFLKEDDDMESFKDETEEDITAEEPTSTGSEDFEDGDMVEGGDEGDEDSGNDITESKKHKKKKCNCGSKCCKKENNLDSLKEAYSIVQENWLKSMGAAAAMTAATAGGANAQQGMTTDDYADKAAIEYAQSPSMPTAPEALEKAVEYIHKNQLVPEPMLKIIATTPETAKRCAYLYFMKGMQIPKTLVNVIGGYEKELKNALKGPLE
jgi:hypothetical protein